MQFSNKTMIMICGLSIFAVLTHWSFWEYGIYSLGFNTTIFWSGLWYILLRKTGSLNLRTNWRWIIPLWLIAISFCVYENPWLKLISFLSLPIVTGLFYCLNQLQNNKRVWDMQLVQFLFSKTLEPLRHIGKSSRYFFRWLGGLFGKGTNLNKRIFTGIVLLIPLAFIITMLLSSADAKFAELSNQILQTLSGYIEFNTFTKLLMTVAISIVLLCVLHCWNQEMEYNQETTFKRLDSVVTGIVMTGILLLYLVFLTLQVDQLLVNRLPINFAQTERMVKSGFWQLFFLSAINTILFYLIYKNTAKIVQILLKVFIIASGLILLSACWRMSLYVYYYGLSYEKFFASYTSIYALCLFIFLVGATFSTQRKNILRHIAFSSLWFYSIATLLPIESIIFHGNIYLSKQQNTRLNLDELTGLSADTLRQAGVYITPSRQSRQIWRDWKYHIKHKDCQRPFLEKNISLMINCRS